MAHLDGTASRATQVRVPSALACLDCRKRHLKCDASLPACARCTSLKRQCHYVKSRRGFRGSAKTATPSALLPVVAQSNVTNSCRELDGMSMGGSCGSDFMDPDHQQSTLPAESLPVSSAPLELHPSATSSYASTLSRFSTDAVQTDPSRSASSHGSSRSPSLYPAQDLVDLYYLRFHPAHPFLLPKQFLSPHASRAYPPHLEAVVHYIGALFLPHASGQAYRDAAEAVLSIPDHERGGHAVQALLLLAIVLHAQNEPDRALKVMGSAIETAQRLGMNRLAFAVAEGEGNHVIEESWRRTWWELFVVNALMAAAHQARTFELRDVEADVALPCEEIAYDRGQLTPQPPTVTLLNNSALNGVDDHGFSSFAYRIDAVRVLGNLMRIQDSSGSGDATLIEELDVALAGWPLQLPASKKEIIDREGNVDEMLFQAYMIIYTATIVLHRPRSDLVFANIPDKTECTPPRHFAKPSSSNHLHSVKAIRAASDLSGLVTLPTSLLSHTPFFSCAIALGAIVHLSAYMTRSSEQEGRLSTQRIRLAVGALKTTYGVWPVAQTLYRQIQALASQALASSPSNGRQSANPLPGRANSLPTLDDGWLEEFVQSLG